MNIFSKITAKTMRANRVRTLVTIIGVILSTSMITAVATFGTSFQRFLVDYSISTNGNWHVAVTGTDASQAASLSEHKDVAKAAVLKTVGYAWFEPVVKQSPSMPYLYVRSLSKAALKMLPADMREGRMPRTEDEIAIPTFLLANESQDNQTKVGDTLTLELGERSYQGVRLGQNNEYMDDEYEDDETFTLTGTRTFTVVGIYNTWPDVAYWAPGYDVLAGPTAEACEYQDVFMELKHPRQVFDFAKENLEQEDAVVMYNHSLLRWLGIADNSNLIVVLAGLMAILIVVIMAGSITLIYNAFSISLRERTVQFGLLSSIGATKKQLRQAMRYEAFFVSIVGIPLGILAGVGGIGVTLHYIGGGLSNWIHGTKAGIPLYVPVWAVAAAAVIAFVTIMISVWLPSRRIRKITPMEAIRSSADIRIRPNEVKTRGWVRALFGLEGMMAQKNYRRDRRKYRATVLSLTMSIGLFTAAGLFQMYLMATGAFVLDAPKTDIQYTLYADVDEHEEDVENILKHTKGIRSVSKHYRESLYFEFPGEWAKEGPLSIYSETLTMADEFSTDAGTQEDTGSAVPDLGNEDSNTRNADSNTRNEDSDTGSADSDTGNEDSDTGNEDFDTGSADSNTGKSLRPENTVWIYANMLILEDEDFMRYAREQKVDASAYQDSSHVKVLYLNAAKNFNQETERYEKQSIFPEETDQMFGAGYMEYDDKGRASRFVRTMEFELGDAVERLPDSFEGFSDRITMILPECMYRKFYDGFQMEGLNAVYALQCEDVTAAFRDLEKRKGEQGLSDCSYLYNVREEYETDQNTLIAVNVLTYGFVILISLIAVANVFHTISTNLMLRRKEFAMLRSMGMSPKGFQRMMNYECLIYGIRSLIYGLVFTALISAALYQTLGAGADVEFLMPWRYLSVAAAGVFGIVFMTMLYTMSTIRNNNIVDELKMN